MSEQATRDIRRAVDTVLDELGGRYVPLAEVCDRVADLLAAEPDPDDVADAMREAIDAFDPHRDEAERYDAAVDDALTGTVFLDPAARDPEWTARMDHYRGDTRYLVAF